MGKYHCEPTKENAILLKMMGKIQEGTRMIGEEGGLFIFQRAVDDVFFRKDLVDFAINYTPRALNYATFLKWLSDNKTERHLIGGSFEKQIKWQEVFYQKFYGKNFQIDRKKILVDARRLPAIKKALEVGCVNYAMIKVVPENISEKETQMTGAEFAFERFAKPLKKDGFRIWEETGTERWTGFTLAELLKRCNPAEPEEFDAEALKKDWIAEEIRVIDKKGPAPKVKPGEVEIIFTNNLPNIPSDQKIVNKDGEVVSPDDRSDISAIANKVRVLSHEEGIILASQLYAKDKIYLAPNTWEWRRDVIDHRDKKTMPPVSAASANSNDDELYLGSSNADNSDDYVRLRVRL